MSKSQNTTGLLPLALGVGIVSFYILFTLLPNSNSMMVKWPWVFIWQVGLMLGPVALLSQLWQNTFRRLGGWLDWLAIAWCSTFVLSAAFAEFFHQAVWYSWAAICGIAYLYVLNSWLTSTRRVQTVLVSQGVLSIVFSAQSLASWYFQTVRPYLQHIEELKTYGIERSFDLQILTLRNWHPLGHQNYVAGYLILTLPLLVGLAFSCKGWRRFAWLGGAVLSLATLYSTASRAGWVALVVSITVFIGLCAWQFPKLRKVLFGTGIVSFGLMVLWGVQSDRIRSLLLFLSDPSGNSKPAYRAITNATGWFMGLDHPILGAGLGSVTLMYQKYRPEWAGTEAQITYQLHSTPAQLWAELGISGVVLTAVSVLVVAYIGTWACKKATEDNNTIALPPLFIGITSGLAGYAVYAVTDYQLDNICISGVIFLFVAILVSYDSKNSNNAQSNTPLKEVSNQSATRRTALVGTGLLVAVSIWLYPVHRAWVLSSQGFLALQQNDVSTFVSYLKKAHQLAPWEPYYPYQLGWNLGELAFQSVDGQQQEILRQESVQWFEKAIKLSPNREFGYSNLGWLLVNSEPQQATAAFLKAAQLTPEKDGIYFALGYSLFKESKVDLAVQAMQVALIQNPALFTSAIWRTSELSQLYSAVLSQFESYLITRLKAEDASSNKDLYQTLGMLHWWQGEYDLAAAAFGHVENPLNKAILQLADSNTGDQLSQEMHNNFPDNLAFAVWGGSNVSDASLINTIFLKEPERTYIDSAYFTSLLEDIQLSASKAGNFHDWLTASAPHHQRRNQRLGFGSVSRHIDGPLPQDFSVVSESVLISQLLCSLVPVSISDLLSFDASSQPLEIDSSFLP